MDEIEVLDRAEISGSNVIVKYSKTEAALADLQAKYSGVVFDLKTTKGDKEARAARLELVNLRTSLEKKRKEFKAPALAFGKKIDSEAERVTTEIVKLETFIDQQIKADEDRRADEKAEKDRIEALRVQAIQDKIATIRGFVAKCQGISAERIAKGIELVSKIDTGADVFFEFQAQAVAAQVETMQAMRDMHAAAAASEAEAARVEAQRLENERIAEQNRIQAEAMAAQQAKLDRAAAAIKAEQDLLEAERTSIAEEERKKAQDRADAEIAKAAEAGRQAAAAIEAAKQPEPDRAQVEGNDILMLAGELVAIPVLKEAGITKLNMGAINTRGGLLYRNGQIIDLPEADYVAKANGYENAEQFVRALASIKTPLQDTQPTLKLGVISTRLGFQVTAEFLRSLGFEPAGRERAAVLYHESDFPRICTALIRHITEVRQGVAIA